MRISKKHTVSPSTIITNCLPRRVEPAGSVVGELAKDIWRLTMTTKPGRFVAFCVQHATRHWGSSETTLDGLMRQHLISELSRHERYLNHLRVAGNNTQTEVDGEEG